NDVLVEVAVGAPSADGHESQGTFLYYPNREYFVLATDAGQGTGAFTVQLAFDPTIPEQEPNDTLDTASLPNWFTPASGGTAARSRGTITPGDADYFQFGNFGFGSGVLSAQVQADGFTPRVEVVDAAGNVIAQGDGSTADSGHVASLSFIPGVQSAQPP